MKKEASMEIEILVEYLTVEDQEVFIEYYIHEKDTAILADETQMNNWVIRDRLILGRNKLKKLKRMFWNSVNKVDILI